MNNDRITGTIVPLPTPFADDESFDITAMRSIIDYLINAGCDSIMPTALTGEALMLTEEETLLVWDAVFESAAGRLPIIPAIISTTTRRAIRLARAAAKQGSVALMAAPVLTELYTRRPQDEVYAFFSEIAMCCGLPIILFNYPGVTGLDLTPGILERLAEIDSVQYIKESTGDSKRVYAIQRLLGERIRVICGAPNVALESFALGCNAWITGIMSIAPRSARQLLQAVHRLGDLELARRIYYNQLLPLVDIMIGNCNPVGTIKEGLNARGINIGLPRRPGSGVSAVDKKRIHDLVNAIAFAEKLVSNNIEAAAV